MLSKFEGYFLRKVVTSHTPHTHSRSHPAELNGAVEIGVKAFLKPFEVPRRSVKIKSFILIQLSPMYGTGRVKRTL